MALKIKKTDRKQADPEESALMFELPEGYSTDELKEAFGKQFQISEEEPEARDITFLDTFDWRVFRAGYLLWYTGHDLFFRKLSSHDVTGSQKMNRRPIFINDIPSGRLKSIVEPVVEMRALLEVGRAESVTINLNLLNIDGKKVVTAFAEILNVREKEDRHLSRARLAVKPVRGYQKAFRRAVCTIHELSFSEESEDIAIAAIREGDRDPYEFREYEEPQLSPEMRADDAARVILKVAFDIMRLNEPGIKKDIDTEFLHDFRVALRRTRSVLSQIKGVFDEAEVERFKKEFSMIGSFSNELRDLDVYLLAEESFKSMLIGSMKDDIEPLFDLMRKKRIPALKRVVEGISSATYAETMRGWEEFLKKNQESGEPPPYASVPVKVLAEEKIFKRFRRVVKRGSRILETSEDSELHSLRIDCKKLRYLMDFFKSLFPAETIEELIRQVKKLQTNLGEFNDLTVQEAYALKMAEQLDLPPSEARKVFLAVGSLTGEIRRKRAAVKEKFAVTFNNFASQENRKLFDTLFNTKEERNG